MRRKNLSTNQQWELIQAWREELTHAKRVGRTGKNKFSKITLTSYAIAIIKHLHSSMVTRTTMNSSTKSRYLASMWNLREYEGNKAQLCRNMSSRNASLPLHAFKKSVTASSYRDSPALSLTEVYRLIKQSYGISII